MKEITLQRTGRVWTARFPDDDEAAQIMGTPVIETAFLADMPGDAVVAAIQRLNPEYRVILA